MGPINQIQDLILANNSHFIAMVNYARCRNHGGLVASISRGLRLALRKRAAGVVARCVRIGPGARRKGEFRPLTLPDYLSMNDPPGSVPLLV